MGMRYKLNTMKNDWAKVFGAEEWAFICRLGSAMNHDPEAKANFWETVKAKKLADVGYSIFSDYPKEIVEKPVSEKAKIAMKYCAPIIEMLRKGKHGVEPVSEEKEVREHEGEGS